MDGKLEEQWSAWIRKITCKSNKQAAGWSRISLACRPSRRILLLKDYQKSRNPAPHEALEQGWETTILEQSNQNPIQPNQLSPWGGRLKYYETDEAGLIELIEKEKG